MNHETEVSMVICTYGRESLLRQTLECAFQQNYRNMEVVVIDQTPNHEPETIRFIEANKSKMRYIFQKNPSVTEARNNGIRNSVGDIVIFTDDDVITDPEFVNNHVRAHDKYDVVQGRVIEQEMVPAKKPLWLNRWIKFSGSDNCITEGPVNVITGCNFSFKRNVIEQVGYFDEFFARLALREDADFGYRCYRAGICMGFSPHACLKHLRSPTGGVGGGIRNMFFDETYYMYDMYFARKHFSKLACAIYKIRLKRRGRKELKKLIERALSKL